jgi:manganese/zinc/iron transport system substrate-binding protein
MIRKLMVKLFCGIIVFGLLISCQIKKYERDYSKKLKVVTTTGIIADVVSNIVGDKADVESLMGAGVDPHLYKASHGDLEKLTSADLVFYNGLHLEGKMGEVLEKLAKVKPVIAVSADMDKKLFTKTGEHSYDPHIWFNVNLWSNTVPKIRKELIIADSSNAPTYVKNSAHYFQRLDSLDKAVKIQIQTIPDPQRVLITAHDAFGYFGKRYGIEVRGLQGISTLSEFGLNDITSLVDFIAERKIKSVFIETSVSEKAINAVVEGCRSRGHQIRIGGSLYSDALGKAGTPEGTYIGMVGKNVEVIVKGLK